MRKFIVRTLLIALAILLVIVGALVIEFTFRRGRTPGISDDLTSIASLEKVRLGGVDQWILLRGWNAANPVVLFLHGGPGMPAMYLAHEFQRELEKHFVVVHWDRRGAGKSYLSGVEGDLSVRQTLEDTYELTRMLRNRFGKGRVYLVGHSWGTYLGTLAASEHPDYYAAYIGIGQISASSSRVSEVQRDFLLRKGGEAGDTLLLRNLRSSSAEVKEDDLFKYGGELFGAKSFWPLLYAGLRAPEYTFSDAMNVKKGADLVARKMRYDVITGPLMEHVRQIKIPVFFFLGRHDYTTPSSLAADYLDKLQAPFKRLIWFENSAHFPFYEEPDLFSRQMVVMNAEVERFWPPPNGQKQR